MFKKICLSLTLFTLTITILLPLFSNTIEKVNAQSSATKLYVDPKKTECWTPALDNVFPINISIANVSDLQAFELKLWWNTTLFDLTKISIESFLNPPISIIKNETNELLGRYWLSILSAGQPKTGSGTLVTIFLKIKYEPTWPNNITSTFNLNDTKLSDSYGNPIYHLTYDGEYSCYSTPAPKITVITDKQPHFLAETFYIYGNLTYGYSLISNGTVALEIDNPKGDEIIVRSLPTGVSPETSLIEIVSLTPCSDQWGNNPKYIFNRGETAFFNVTIKNNGAQTLPIRYVINVFDSKTRPIGLLSLKGSAYPGKSSWVTSFYIPEEAATGDSTVFASILTNWPKLNGTPYCPEKAQTFQIEESGSESPPEIPLPKVNYNLTFNLLLEEGGGNYSVYVSARYKGQTTTNSMTLQIKIPDVNNDGVVDLFDLVKVAKAYASSPGDPNWDPEADVNGDNTVDIFDLVIISKYYGAKYV